MKRNQPTEPALEYRSVTQDDLDLLAEWNHQLIRDEGHRNPMTIPELKERMLGWLEGEYIAVMFLLDDEPVAYSLYRERLDEIYLRQFFVRRDLRRQGIGRQAIALLREKIWSQDKRLTVEVLTANRSGVAFWHSVGYQDYSLALEILPRTRNAVVPRRKDP